MFVAIAVILVMLSNRQRWHALPQEPFSVKDIHRSAHMTRILDGTSHNCVEYIWMSKDTFLILCAILRECDHLRDIYHPRHNRGTCGIILTPSRVLCKEQSNDNWILLDQVRQWANMLMMYSKLFVALPGTSIHPDIEFNPNSILSWKCGVFLSYFFPAH